MLEAGIPDHHKLIGAILRSKFAKVKQKLLSIVAKKTSLIRELKKYENKNCYL